MDVEQIKKEVEKIGWWHKIDLGNGIITPGKSDTLKKIKRIGIPNDLSGKTVLDIGAWDGFFSFECEKRGAKRVLATDSWVWQGKGWGSKKGFELVRKVFDSKVEDMEIDILDLSPEKVETFDIVLFLGVLYHMRHPLLALEKVYSVTKEMAIIETATDMLDFKRPAMAFYPDREFNNGPTTWCGPNPACVEGMLKAVGFKKVKFHHNGKILYRETNRLGMHKPGVSLKDPIPVNSIVFHAWK